MSFLPGFAAAVLQPATQGPLRQERPRSMSLSKRQTFRPISCHCFQWLSMGNLRFACIGSKSNSLYSPIGGSEAGVNY